MAEGSDQDQDDKTEEPTQKRLDDALEQGDTIYSVEATTWLVLAAATAMIAMMTGPMARELGADARIFLEQAHTFSVDGGALRQLLAKLGAAIFMGIGGATLAFMLAGIAGRYLQDRPSFSAKKLAPSLDKINPFEGFKRVYGPAAFANFFKGLLKFIVVGAAVAWALWPRDGAYTEGALLDVAALLPLAQSKVMSVLMACLCAFGVLAAADYFFTRQSFIKRLRMTPEELKREYKESEGDPYLKAKIRQIRQERARKRMMAAVPGATVVVTNPTHYAVALKYEPGKFGAPICVAKGADAIALRIRAVAEENGVPLVEEPPLARALFATAEIDAVIPREHFEAVAKVIGIVMNLAARRRRTSS